MVTSYQLDLNSHLVATMPHICTIWYALVHVIVVCKAVMPKKGTTTTKELKLKQLQTIINMVIHMLLVLKQGIKFVSYNYM